MESASRRGINQSWIYHQNPYYLGMGFLYHYWREILSGAAVIIALYSYIQYIRSIFAQKTEPHVFSWWIWALTTGIAFFAQVAGGGGWGSAQSGVTFVVCIGIAILAFRYGKIGKFDRLDWYALTLAFMAIGLWKMMADPFYGSLFAMLADVIGYIPTFRKVWKKPESEPRGYYLLMNVKHGLSLLALSRYTWTTMIFSGSVIVINFVLILVQIFRKKKHHA